MYRYRFILDCQVAEVVRLLAPNSHESGYGWVAQFGLYTLAGPNL